MKTAKEREAEFMAEFKALLKKWDAEIAIEEDRSNRPYMELYINSGWKDGEFAGPLVADLGTCVNGD